MHQSPKLVDSDLPRRDDSMVNNFSMKIRFRIIVSAWRSRTISMNEVESPEQIGLTKPIFIFRLMKIDRQTDKYS